jgi:hypothetical protein
MTEALSTLIDAVRTAAADASPDDNRALLGACRALASHVDGHPTPALASTTNPFITALGTLLAMPPAERWESILSFAGAAVQMQGASTSPAVELDDGPRFHIVNLGEVERVVRAKSGNAR